MYVHIRSVVCLEIGQTHCIFIAAIRLVVALHIIHNISFLHFVFTKHLLRSFDRLYVRLCVCVLLHSHSHVLMFSVVYALLCVKMDRMYFSYAYFEYACVCV